VDNDRYLAITALVHNGAVKPSMEIPMPIQIIVPEGALTPAAEAEAFRKLTELLLRLHGLTGNRFMTPNVIGEVTVVPKGRTFSGGKPADIAVFELKVPSFVLPTQELKDAWISEGTTIIEQAAAGRIKREHIYANVNYAVEGAWGIGGKAFSNEALGSAVAAA
jgi:phenylpyruvate tautomerase PptA (4-oxalocrotonate tautomerase family)